MPTFFSAVSLAVALGAGAQTMSGPDRAAFNKVRPWVVTLLDGGSSRGSALVIDGKSLLMAHQTALGVPPLRGRASDGRLVSLTVLTDDPATQLVLLRSSTPLGDGSSRLKIAAVGGGRLVALLPNGPVVAEVAGEERIGMMPAAQRLFTLNEIQFESPQSTIGGAPLINMQGELVGVLGAALAPENSHLGNAMEIARPMAQPSAKMLGMAKFGPSGMTVGYALTADVVQRVVAGFLSPDRKVQHPILGVMCREVEHEAGVLIEVVQPNSPAHKAGLKKGDLIVEMNGDPVAGMADYGRVMARQRVGAVLSLTIRRGGAMRIVRVLVAA